jgi:hypothetical protein
LRLRKYAVSAAPVVAAEARSSSRLFMLGHLERISSAFGGTDCDCCQAQGVRTQSGEFS